MGDRPINPKISKIERMVIEVKKYLKPILSPDWKEFKDKYSSLRNSGGILYDNGINQIILLITARYKQDGKSRLHIAKSYDGHNFKLEEKPFIDLDNDSLLGVEDPRISKIGEEYYITFTAFKETDKKIGNTTRIGFVKTKDFKKYTDRQIILDNYGNNKNCVIFQIPNYKGFYVIHRPFINGSTKRAATYITRTRDFKKWEDSKILFKPRKNMWDSARVGINTPPIKIKHKKYGDSLLLLYHGAEEISNLLNYLGLKKHKKNIYRIGYIIVDEKNPEKILERSKENLMEPELDFEIGRGKFSAEVPNVIFGCGIIPMNKNILRFYYAGADKYTSFADLTLKNMEIPEEIFQK